MLDTYIHCIHGYDYAIEYMYMQCFKTHLILVSDRFNRKLNFNHFGHLIKSERSAFKLVKTAKVSSELITTV